MKLDKQKHENIASESQTDTSSLLQNFNCVTSCVTINRFKTSKTIQQTINKSKGLHLTYSTNHIPPFQRTSKLPNVSNVIIIGIQNKKKHHHGFIC